MPLGAVVRSEGKRLQVSVFPGVGVETLQDLVPIRPLRIVQLTLIEQSLLMDRAGCVSNSFDHAPVAMFFAISFFRLVARRNIGLDHATDWAVLRKGWVFTTSIFEMKTVDLLGNPPIGTSILP